MNPDESGQDELQHLEQHSCPGRYGMRDAGTLTAMTDHRAPFTANSSLLRDLGIRLGVRVGTGSSTCNVETYPAHSCTLRIVPMPMPQPRMPELRLGFVRGLRMTSVAKPRESGPACRPTKCSMEAERRARTRTNTLAGIARPTLD